MQYSLGSAKWIWTSKSAMPDEYGEFYSEFEYRTGKVTLSISADSHYAVYVNGALATFGQYADFPYDKVYDEVDITENCRSGKNTLAVIVWYFGVDTTQVYASGRAALMFSLSADGKELAASSERTLSRKSPSYINHKRKIITNQLGFSFAYDGSTEDAWMKGALIGFTESAEVDQQLPLRPRPCKKLELLPPVKAKLIKKLNNTRALYDLGINTVGFIGIKTNTTSPMHITVSYGEHIADGCVRRLVGGRDFSVDITTPEGEFSYMNPFRRVGCKYLEIECERPEDITEISVVPTVYPVNILPMPEGLSDIEKQIYEICLRTLTLCMHEHYEDCPWREQALYAMDSRNQMLTGYYAFGEYEFPRASLELISKDNREDGLLSICYPIFKDLVIPSFSLHYFTACREYLDYTGDKEFIKEIFPKLKSILSVFLGKGAEKGEVIRPFATGTCYWNFYEWENALSASGDLRISGSGTERPEDEPDLIINTLLILALRNMASMAAAIGEPDTYSDIADKLTLAARNHFYDKERSLFFDRCEARTYSKLGNSLAILAGLPSSKRAASAIARALVKDESLTEISLSMRCFLNDALLLVDSERYAPYVLSEIERIYRPMVEYGVGTVWETELGESDFANAGSLCHGWSALPIYYYHILKK